jgi:GT2 family glycosyltransferase
METDTTKVSIVIINYNGVVYLPKLFESIAKQTFRQFEVLLWDNNSTDESLKWLNDNRPKFPLKIIVNEQNIGFGKAINRAILQTKGQHICLLNNDTYVSQNLLEILYNQVIKDDVDVVGPKILFTGSYFDVLVNGPKAAYVKSLPYLSHPNRFKTFINNDDPFKRLTRTGRINIKQGDRLQMTIGESIALPNTFFWDSSSNSKVEDVTHRSSSKLIHCTITPNQPGKHIINSVGLLINGNNGKAKDRGIFEYDVGQYDSYNRVDGLSGCCFMIKKDLFKTIGFDEKFFMYYEDVDFFVRLRQQYKQAKVVYCPEATVFHHNGSINQSSKIRIINKSHLIFVRKHSGLRTYVRHLLIYCYSRILNFLRYIISN